MPYLNLQITRGASRAQNSQFVAEFTETLVRVLGRRREPTHIVISEITEEDWGFAGMLTDDYRKANS